jgi:hypothetical protein
VKEITFLKRQQGNKYMKSLTSLIYIIFLAGGAGMFLGLINAVVDELGATYYWDSVVVGLVIFVMIFHMRTLKGYEVRGNAQYVMPITLLCGVVGFPNMLLMLPLDEIAQINHIGTLITLGAFAVIVSCGFSGTREPECNNSTEV